MVEPVQIEPVVPVNPTAPPTEAAPPPTWYSTVPDPELRGHIETKGWGRLDPAAAAAEAAKAHRNAERMLGAPADQLVRLPSRPDDEAGWRSVYQRLGAPDKPEAYDFAGLELQDPDLTTRFQSAIRNTAAELNMPKPMAERMAQAFHKFIDETGQRVDAEQAAALRNEQDELVRDWGDPKEARFRGNMFVADRAAEQLGVTPEQLAKLKDGLGAAGVAKLFHQIGVRMGEDRFITGGNPTQQGLMSREQAIARRAELMHDKDWTARYMAGGGPEKREMLALNTLITGA